ncbi:winged helix-turn-helix transcriptional regulator [Gudongella sp. DL1XJH-153]|uniref:winged helix-turn-helix transcriptional regulator n=1 Tax=Gudongella sp. DL1XJH-153 TaxID=3409804 RepID=UPI003BB5CA0A
MRKIDTIKDNGFFLPTLKYKELMILEYMDNNPDTTQKELGKAIGAATSMINAYIDEYEMNGYVRREYITSKKVKYHVTPKGQKRKNYLNVTYIQELMDLHKLAKAGVEEFLKRVSQKGFHSILLYGAGEVAEIILNVVNNTEDIDMKVQAIVDDDLEKRGTELLGYPVISKVDIKKYEHDGVMVSSYTFENIIRSHLLQMGYEDEKIIQFFGEWE